MKQIARCLLLASFLLNGYVCLADVRLPSVYGSHMVLQQNSEVSMWGWSDPHEKITLKLDWDTTTYITYATGSAKWTIKFKTPAAGGPHTISIKGRNTLQLDDILVGEVWLCSGQSNMEMNMNWGIKQYDADVAQAANDSIRFFQVQKTTSEYPQDDIKGQWVVSTPEAMKNFSAVGYFFGNKLNKELKVPVGLINSSWGGTPAEVWTPKEVVEGDPVLLSDALQRNPAMSQGWPVSPGLTFNAMIHPLTSMPIAGAIWYQGESNTGSAANYEMLFTSMIGAWRRAWHQNFPFYFVQIAPYAGYGNKNIAPLLRLAQTKSLSYPKTGMVVIHDLVDDIKDIHPKMKKEVGLRLANLALADNYGQQGIAYKSPEYAGMKVEKNKIRIMFDYAANGLMAKGGEPTEFFIAGTDRKFVAANAKIEGNTIVVSSKEVPEPVAVRFGFSNSAMPNLYNKEGLPVDIFRTDNWPVDTSAASK